MELNRSACGTCTASTNSACLQATTNWGLMPPRNRSMRSMHVTVLGGSVSCNRNIGTRNDSLVSAPPGAPDDPTATNGWPQRLLAMLRACPPRGVQKITLENLCRGSVGTDYWIQAVTKHHDSLSFSSRGQEFHCNLYHVCVGD